MLHVQGFICLVVIGMAADHCVIRRMAKFCPYRVGWLEKFEGITQLCARPVNPDLTDFNFLDQRLYKRYNQINKLTGNV